MRLLALVTDAFGGYGGIAQYNRDFLAAAASEPGVREISVLPRIAPGSFEPLPANVTQLAPVYGRAAYALAAYGQMRRFRPDAIFNGHLYHGPLARWLSRMFGAPVISQLHGTEIWAPASRGQLDALVRSRIVCCVSRHTRQMYLRQAPAQTDNAVIVPNTVGEAFVPGDRVRARVRWGLGEAFAILTVARLDGQDGYKGHDRILRALPDLLRAREDVLYLIAGLGEDQPRLEALAAELGVSEKVRFIGKVPFADLPDLYRAADLFALPSTGEGFGIVFLEAMACGTPAIGLDFGGASDALGEGELGICVSDADFPHALREALFAQREAPENLASKVRAKFGRDVFRARVADALSRLVAPAARRAA